MALGKGHPTEFWTDWMGALAEIDPDMAVNIRYEDTELGRTEGLRAPRASSDGARP